MVFLGIFPKWGRGLRYSLTLCEVLVAIVFGLENKIFLAKFHIFSPIENFDLLKFDSLKLRTHFISCEGSQNFVIVTEQQKGGIGNFGLPVG